ncbi:MAG TPA: MoaD/ThiS family protein [Candidatus Thermoplasmatota archaeon]|nr:MoaD/ThiS family protein [Candidatus Thermoplasmatota archaeon]
MKIQVRLFSVLRDRAGTGHLELELPTESDVQAATDGLTKRHPRLAEILAGRDRVPIRFAVNREYAGPTVRLHDGDELAVFPPMSGGSGDGSRLGRGMLLLSGGFDSPVAGHLVKEGGHELNAVHFTMEPFTDDASAKKAAILAAKLGIGRLTIVPLGTDLAEFTRRCEHRHYFVLLKRLMLRVAQEVAGRTGAAFLVTGENLGQVSSQTLANLAAIDGAARLPVLRPLLGLDKEDIIRFAKRIGTYETSKGPELCDLLGPKHPSTASTAEQVAKEEAKVDVDALVASAMSRAFEVALVSTRTVAG